MKKITTIFLLITLLISCLSFVSCFDDETDTTYTVTFATQGGSTVSSQTIKEGEKAVRPKDPTKSGYAFLGWYLDGVQYDFNSPVVSDIRLVAEWTKIGDGVDFPWIDLPTS